LRLHFGIVYPLANADNNRSSDRFQGRMNVAFIVPGTKTDAVILDEIHLGPNLGYRSFGILFFSHMRQKLAHA
jgi:hypothetical protein